MTASASPAVPAPRRGRLRAWTVRATALVAGCAVAVVLAEIVLRVARDQSAVYPYHRNSVSVTYTDPELTPGVSGTAVFSTNSLGCRGPELGKERHRLLVIGGSTAACSALSDDEEWAHLVMTGANERRKDPDFLWVTNSAIDGLNTRHHLMHCEYLLPRMPKLDHVLVYCGLNDVGYWLYRETFDPNDLDDPQRREETIGACFRDSSFVPPGSPWYRRLALWKAASRIKSVLASRDAQAMRTRGAIVEDDRMRWLEVERKRRAEWDKQFVPKAKFDTLPVALDAYDRNLRKMIELIRQSGAEPILMAQSIAFKSLTEQEKKQLWMGAMDGGRSYVDEEQMQSLVDQFNQRMQTTAADCGAHFIDLPAALDGEPGIFYDGCHFNEHGARAVARVVVGELLAKVYRE